MSKILILGSGPAALAAAEIVQTLGYVPTIISKKAKSPIFGCQYLHAPVPGLIGPQRVWDDEFYIDCADVTYSLVGGTPEEYKKKVYGDRWDGKVSPEDLEMDHLAFDLRATYDYLWAKWSPLVIDHEITDYAGLEQFVIKDSSGTMSLAEYDLIISTIPRTVWKQPGDTFSKIEAWAFGDAPGIQEVPFKPESDNTIICDAGTNPSWYRLARVFNHTTIEWPDGKKPPLAGVSKLTKPLAYHPGNIWNDTNGEHWLHIGRYGEWKKGVLLSDTFEQVFNRVIDL